MAEPKARAREETRIHPWVFGGAILASIGVAAATGLLLALLGLAIENVVADPFQLTDARVTGLVVGGGLWIIFATAVALEAGIFVAVRAMRFPNRHPGVLIGLAIWSLAFLAPGVGGAKALADTVMTTTEATTLAMQGDEEISLADLQSATNMAREASLKLVFWGGAGLALGVVGALAGDNWLSGSSAQRRRAQDVRASHRVTSLSLWTPHRWAKLDS